MESDFRAHLARQGLSVNTMRAYLEVITLLERHTGTPIDDVTPDEAAAFLNRPGSHNGCYGRSEQRCDDDHDEHDQQHHEHPFQHQSASSGLVIEGPPSTSISSSSLVWVSTMNVHRCC